MSNRPYPRSVSTPAPPESPAYSLPHSWEEEKSFQDEVYEWMQSAPWLALSLAAHVVAFFILSAIPWSLLHSEPDTVIQANTEPPVDEVVIEEPEEPEDPLLEPELMDADELEVVEDPVEADDTEDFVDDAYEEGDPDLSADAPFDNPHFQNVLGIGPGGGSKMGNRGTGRGKGKGGAAVQETVRAALKWLAEHQSPDGSWDADGFTSQCGSLGSTVCTGTGQPAHDVGMTGLALLAFLGQGNTTAEGSYRDVVGRGIKWLLDRQDDDTGLIGDSSSHAFIYDHALATLALSENYYYTKSPLQKRSTQEAVYYIQRARHPYGAWSYEVPNIGRNDTSVTGWMVFALSAAREAGLEVDPAAFDGALSWFDEATDPATGRVGYDAMGTLSARNVSNEHYPPEKGEALTAVGLLCRIFLGQDPGEHPILIKHAELLQRTPPEWDAGGFGCDMYYWYYATYAMFQLGGRWWRTWESTLDATVIETQRKDGDERGSWDPVGPWGYSGGRVYSTALMTLTLQVRYRYSRLLGSR